MNSNNMIDLDLPSLQSIQLGYEALQGRKDNTCSLIMRSNKESFLNDLFCRSSITIKIKFNRT